MGVIGSLPPTLALPHKGEGTNHSSQKFRFHPERGLDSQLLRFCLPKFGPQTMALANDNNSQCHVGLWFVLKNGSYPFR